METLGLFFLTTVASCLIWRISFHHLRVNSGKISFPAYAMPDNSSCTLLSFLLTSCHVSWCQRRRAPESPARWNTGDLYDTINHCRTSSRRGRPHVSLSFVQDYVPVPSTHSRSCFDTADVVLQVIKAWYVMTSAKLWLSNGLTLGYVSYNLHVAPCVAFNY